MVGFLIAVMAAGMFALYAASVAMAEYGEARDFDRERAQVARVANELRVRVRSMELERAGQQTGNPSEFLKERLGGAEVSEHCDADDDVDWQNEESGDAFGYEDPALAVEKFRLCWTMQPPVNRGYRVNPGYRVFVRGTEQLRMLAEGSRLGSRPQRVDLQHVPSGQALVERVYTYNRLEPHTVTLTTLPDFEWPVGEAATSGSGDFAKAMLVVREGVALEIEPAHDAFAHEKHHARDEMHAAVGLRIGVFSEAEVQRVPNLDTFVDELPEKPWAREFHEKLWVRMEWGVPGVPGTAVGDGKMLRDETRKLVDFLHWNGENHEAEN